MVALQQEDHHNALGLHNKAYQLYQDIRDNYDQAVLLYYRSFVYEAMQQRQQAIDDVQKSLAIAVPLNLPFVDLLHERLEKLPVPS